MSMAYVAIMSAIATIAIFQAMDFSNKENMSATKAAPSTFPRDELPPQIPKMAMIIRTSQRETQSSHKVNRTSALLSAEPVAPASDLFS